MDELNPITRQEKIIAGENIQPITRMEKLLAGEDLEPVTRLEHFVKKYKDGSGSGGGTGGGGVEHSDYINPEWTDWQYFSTSNNRNSLVKKLKYNDTANGTNFKNMFRESSSLTNIPSLNTINGTDFSYMFYGCNKLITINTLNVSKGTRLTSMFTGCGALENITFEGIVPVNSDINLFPYNQKLTVDSLMSFINALQNTSGTTYKVTIGSTNLAKLTADQIQIATDKNITLA